MKQFDIYNRYKRAIQLMLDFKFLTHGLKKHKGILAMAIKKFSKLKDSIEKIDKKIERLSDRKEFIAKNIDSKESKNVKLVNFSKLDTQSSHEKSTLLELFQKLTQMIYLIQRVSMRIDKVCEKVESLYRSSPPSVRESSAHYNQSIVSLLVYIKKNNVVRSDINHLIEHFTTLISHTPIHQRISSRHNTNLNFLKSTTKQFEFFTYNYFNQPFDERLLAAISNLMSTCYERIFELKNITGPAINKNDDHERVINNYLKQSETTLKMLKAQCSKVNKPAHRLKYLRRNLHN